MTGPGMTALGVSMTGFFMAGGGGAGEVITGVFYDEDFYGGGFSITGGFRG